MHLNGSYAQNLDFCSRSHTERNLSLTNRRGFLAQKMRFGTIGIFVATELKPSRQCLIACDIYKSRAGEPGC
jgi:hypothetical protein